MEKFKPNFLIFEVAIKALKENDFVVRFSIYRSLEGFNEKGFRELNSSSIKLYSGFLPVVKNNIKPFLEKLGFKFLQQTEDVETGFNTTGKWSNTGGWSEIVFPFPANQKEKTRLWYFLKNFISSEEFDKILTFENTQLK